LQKEPFNYPFSKQDSISQQLDPLGERDFFYESDQIRAINRRVLTDAKDPITITMAEKSKGFPLSDLVHDYLDHEPAYNPEVSRIINYYIPDFSRLDIQCNAIYQQTMRSTYALNELRSFYNEKCELLYHFIVTKFVILSQQAKYGLASQDQIDFIEAFRNTFPPERLPISGMYRPFYIGLNSSKPADNRFAEVIPYLPPVSALNLTAANNQLAPLPIFSLVPNFAGILRIIHQQGGHHPAPPQQFVVSTYENDNRLWENDFEFNYPNPNQNDVWSPNRMLRWRRWTPGLLNPASRCKSMADIADYQFNALFPTPSYRTINQNINNEFQEMGFADNINWFENLVTQQARVSRYWHESTTLDQLVKQTTGYGLYVSCIREPLEEDPFAAYNAAHQAQHVANDLAVVTQTINHYNNLGIHAPAAGVAPNAQQIAFNALFAPLHLRQQHLNAAAALPMADDEEAVFDIVNPIRELNPREPAMLRTDMYQEIRETELMKEVQLGAQITNWHADNYITDLSHVRGVQPPHNVHLYNGAYWDIVCTYKSSPFRLGPRIHIVPALREAFIVKPMDTKST
jgi:hypothetical protein